MVSVNFTKILPVLDPALLLLLQQLQQLQLPEVVKSFLEENLLHSGKTDISESGSCFEIRWQYKFVFTYSGD